MKKNFLKLFLLTLSFFLFELTVEAKEEYSLISQSDNPVTCVYKSDKLVEVSLIYDENGDAEAYLNGFTPLSQTIKSQKIFKPSHCPEKIFIDTNSIVVSRLKVSCGNIEKIPRKIPELTSFAMTVIQVAVPVILVIMGSIDFFKSISSGKEDEMKKGQKMFVKRIIVGIVIFLVVVLVKFFISIVADANVSNMVDCIDCFIWNDCN